MRLEKWEGKLNQRIILVKVDEEEKLLNEDFLESNEVYYIKSKISNLYLTQVGDYDEAKIVQKEYDAY